MRQLPFIRSFSSRLLIAWRAAGHSVGVDTWLRVRQLLKTLPPDTLPERLKTLVAPLLATNAAEQAELYALIDRFAAQIPRPRPWWQRRSWLLVLGILTLTLGAAAWEYYQQQRSREVSDTITVSVSMGRSQVQTIDENLLVQTNETALSIQQIDTAGQATARVFWGAEPLTLTVTGLAVGRVTLPMFIRIKKRTGLFLSRSKDEPLEVDRKFNLVVDVLPTQVAETKSSEDLPAALNTLPYDHQPDISTLRPEEISLFSFRHAYWDISKTAAAFGGLLLLLQITYLLLLLRYRREKKRQEQDTQVRATPLRKSKNTKPPYTWQFRVPYLSSVELGTEASAILTQLRQRSADERYVLNIPQTLQATLRQGGRIALQYSQPTRPDEYLLLLDFPSAHHHAAQLFDLLYRMFAEQEILIERFYYRLDPRLCWNEKYPQGITLPELQHQYGAHRLLIVGRADMLLSPTTGQLSEWTKIFEAWPIRSILSVKPVAYWRNEEERLSELFRLAPANIEGLAALTTTVLGDDAPSTRFWKNQETEDSAPIVLDDDFEAETILAVLEAEYLQYANRQRDERQLLWLAACAVSPVLHWDATLFFGAWADEPDAAEPLLSVDKLLNINRLPWFSEGKMPENARRALLQWLANERPEALLRLRSAWKQVLEDNLEALRKNAEEKKQGPFEETAAYDELRMTLLVNELALNEIKPEQLPPESRRQLEQELRDRIAQSPPDFVALEILKRADEREETELQREAAVQNLEPPVPFPWRFVRWQLPGLALMLLGIWGFNPGDRVACTGTEMTYLGETYCLQSAQDSLVYWEHVFCDTAYTRERAVLDAIRAELAAKQWNRLPPERSQLWAAAYRRNTLLQGDTLSKAPYIGSNDSMLLQQAVGIIRREHLDSVSFYRNIPVAWWNKGVQFYNAGQRELACVCFENVQIWPGNGALFTAKDTLLLSRLKGSCRPSTEASPETTAVSNSALENLMKNRKSGLSMKAIQGGTFMMGSPSTEAGRDDDECQHSVALASFKIGYYEVTQADWYEVMGTRPSGFSDCNDCPVEKVSWIDIQGFLKKLNEKTGLTFRLPTEAEWEFAARGGVESKKYLYSGSNTLGDVAWYDSNSGSKTHSVGTKKANELGLFDMSGNVWEWCQDTYQPYPCDGKTDGDDTVRVLRGGSWYDSNGGYRCAERSSVVPSLRSVIGGFRLAQD